MRRHALFSLLAITAALSPTKRAALEVRTDVPVFDASVYKKAYYANFAEAKWRQRGGLASATTRQATPAPAAQLGDLGDLFALDTDDKGWRDLFATSPRPIKYRKRQELKRAFYKAAEREHGRAALLGAAFISGVAWDARLGPLVLFARCGCPQALNQFAEGSPNAFVEPPLALMSLAYLARELNRSFNGDGGGDLLLGARGGDLDAATRKARGLSLRAELFQGRLAMVFTAAVVLLAQPLTGHADALAVGDVVDAAVATL